MALVVLAGPVPDAHARFVTHEHVETDVVDADRYPLDVAACIRLQM